MVLSDCFDGTTHDSTHLPAFANNGFCQLCFELISDASHAVYRHFFVPIDGNVPVDEQAESLDEHVVNGRIGAVLDDERNQRSKEGIGGRLAVNALNDVRKRQIELIAKLLLECFGKFSFEESVQQHLAKIGAAAFIAKNVTEWRCMLHNVFPIVETAVGARSKNAGYARFVPTNGSGGTQQVALHLNVALGEEFLEGTLNTLAERFYAAGTIEINSLQTLRLRQLSQQIMV